MTVRTVDFRGVGGEYLVQVQAADEWTTADEWLYATLVASGGVGSRVYAGRAPETAVLTDAGTGAPLIFCTFTSKDADPDTRGYGVGGAVAVVANLHYEIVFWRQGQSFAGLGALAGALRTTLDVAQTAVSGGTILGAKRLRPMRGAFTRTG